MIRSIKLSLMSISLAAIAISSHSAMAATKIHFINETDAVVNFDYVNSDKCTMDENSRSQLNGKIFPYHSQAVFSCNIGTYDMGD